MDIHEIQQAITSLSPEEFARLREWFWELDEELWDKQMEADAKSGKFDKLIAETREKNAARVVSPRLVNSDQVSDFKMDVSEE